MSQMLSLIVGISSSLVATLIFIGTSEFIRRIVLPWYADKIYRGVRIDGEWDSTNITYNNGENTEHTDFRIKLTQKGDAVKGILIIDSDRKERYAVNGEIRDSIFCATMRSDSPYHLDAASCVLRVYCPGADLNMQGKLSFICQSSSDVESISINFKRHNS